MADEVYLRETLEDLVESFESQVVHLVLEMDQDGNRVFICQFEYSNHGVRIARHVELEFADSDSAFL